MSSPSETRPIVEDQEFSDIVAALMLDPPATESPPTEVLPAQQNSAPTIVHGPVIAYGPVTTLAPPARPVLPATPQYSPVPSYSVTPSLFLDSPERWWDSNTFWNCIVATKWLAILGSLGVFGYFIVYPVVLFVIMVASFIGSAIAAVGSVAIVALVVFWATALLGYWDHPKPVRSGQVKAEPATRLVVDSSPISAPSKESWLFRPRESSSKPMRSSQDELTTKWLSTMRDPKSQQALGELRESIVDENGATVGYTDARCAGGWLIHCINERSDRKARKIATQTYGIKLLRRAARMNDDGVKLAKIADFVEKERT